MLGLFQIFFVISVSYTNNPLISVASAQMQTQKILLSYYNSPTSMILALSMAISVSFLVIGCGLTIKTLGTATISALSEYEGSFFKVFLIVGLGEALSIYGLLLLYCYV